MPLPARLSDWLGEAAGRYTRNELLLIALGKRDTIERMRAARTLRSQGTWPGRWVDNPQHPFSIDLKPTKITCLPGTNICLCCIFVQSNQPKNGLSPVKARYSFAVDFIPSPTHARLKEAEQRRVVKSPANSLMHSKIDAIELAGIHTATSSAEIATKSVMNASRSCIDLAI